jgi:hypothetical protein
MINHPYCMTDNDQPFKFILNLLILKLELMSMKIVLSDFESSVVLDSAI